MEGNLGALYLCYNSLCPQEEGAVLGNAGLRPMLTLSGLLLKVLGIVPTSTMETATWHAISFKADLHTVQDMSNLALIT